MPGTVIGFCQITSNPYSDSRAVILNESDFQTGSLRITSYARPGKLFTANQQIIESSIAVLKSESFKKIVDAIVHLLHTGIPKENS